MTAPAGTDPRLTLAPEDLDAASIQAMPQVAARAGGIDSVLILGMVGVLAMGVVTWLAISQPAPSRPKAGPFPTFVDRTASPSVLPPIDPSAGVESAPVAPPEISQPSAPVNQTSQPLSRGDGSPMVMDLTGPGTAQASASALTSAAPATSILNSNDQFAARLDGDVSATAKAIGNPADVVVQGSVIPAVLETAIKSDLPGYTRAIVSRDVHGFDGTKVLIPRGSALVGQYKSGLAVGETRAFVIWTRLIRPDGLSVSLGSPVTDDLGQAGMAGRVDSHFVKRFGSAILLSVVNGLSGSLGNQNDNTIVIGSSSQATNVATEALSSDVKISPTVNVAPGSQILIFAARDLDFGAR